MLGWKGLRNVANCNFVGMKQRKTSVLYRNKPVLSGYIRILCLSTSRSHNAMLLFSKWSQMMWKCGKNQKGPATFWGPVWSVTVQTHSNIETFCFVWGVCSLSSTYVAMLLIGLLVIIPIQHHLVEVVVRTATQTAAIVIVIVILTQTTILKTKTNQGNLLFMNHHPLQR